MPRPDDATLWPGGNPYPFRRPQLRERGVRRTPDPNDTDEEGRERAAIDSLLFFVCVVLRDLGGSICTMKAYNSGLLVNRLLVGETRVHRYQVEPLRRQA